MSKCKLALNAILVLLLFLPFAHAAVSEEQVQSVGGSSLTDAMPDSARQSTWACPYPVWAAPPRCLP